jgi:hypothetical protein
MKMALSNSDSSSTACTASATLDLKRRGLAQRFGLGGARPRRRNDDSCTVDSTIDDVHKAPPARKDTVDFSVSDSLSSTSDDDFTLSSGSIFKKSVRFSEESNEFFHSCRSEEEIRQSWDSKDEIKESRERLDRCVDALRNVHDVDNFYSSEYRAKHMRRGIEHLLDADYHEHKLRQGRSIRQAVLKATQKGCDKAAKVSMQLSAVDVKEAKEKAGIDVATAIDIYSTVFRDCDKLNVQSNLQALKESTNTLNAKSSNGFKVFSLRRKQQC